MVEQIQNSESGSESPIETSTAEETKAVSKKSTKKPFSINVIHARHELPLLNEIIAQNKWRKVEHRDHKADMIWQFPLHESESK